MANILLERAGEEKRVTGNGGRMLSSAAFRQGLSILLY
jgi:hypothetical protein